MTTPISRLSATFCTRVHRVNRKTGKVLDGEED